jgi:hypothetical protein
MNQIAPMSEFLLREAVPHPSPEFRVPLLKASGRDPTFESWIAAAMRLWWRRVLRVSSV